jgi:hypothetical protein
LLPSFPNFLDHLRSIFAEAQVELRFCLCLAHRSICQSTATVAAADTTAEHIYSNSNMVTPANAGLAASLLEIERDRLQLSNQHLERSVQELKQAMLEDPDPEYKAAISENLVVIAKQRARVASLEDEIRRAKGLAGDISHAQVAAVPVGGSGGPATAAGGRAQGQEPQDSGTAAGQQPAQQQDLDSTAAAAGSSEQQQPAAQGDVGMWL